MEHGAARGTGAVGGGGDAAPLAGSASLASITLTARHSRAPQRQARQADPLASAPLEPRGRGLEDLSRFLFGNVVAAARRIRNFRVRWDIYLGLTWPSASKKRPQTKEKPQGAVENESEREQQTVADRRGRSGGTTDHPTSKAEGSLATDPRPRIHSAPRARGSALPPTFFFGLSLSQCFSDSVFCCWASLGEQGGHRGIDIISWRPRG